MARVISIHSFYRGTGKSNLAANIATLLAMEGRRVCVVDTDLAAPSLHVLFGLREDEISYRLNDYLDAKCLIEQSAYDLGARFCGGGKGKLFLVPSSTRVSDISKLLCEGCDMDLLSEGFKRLGDILSLDTIIVDTHAGLNEETLISFALCDTVAVILDMSRPSSDSCQVTAVTVDVARKLDTPSKVVLIVNKAPAFCNPDELKTRVERAYNCETAAVLPHSVELMALGSAGIFVLNFPDHPLTASLKRIPPRLMP